MIQFLKNPQQRTIDITHCFNDKSVPIAWIGLNVNDIIKTILLLEIQESLASYYLELIKEDNVAKRWYCLQACINIQEVHKKLQTLGIDDLNTMQVRHKTIWTFVEACKDNNTNNLKTYNLLTGENKTFDTLLTFA